MSQFRRIASSVCVRGCVDTRWQRGRVRRGSMRIKDDHPELFRQLHPTRNVGLDPGSVTNSSHRMLWWLCPAGHEWLESAFQRTSHMGWKNGDRYACLYCVAPGCVVNSCGHRKFRGGKNAFFRVLAHPCEKCEITEHARLILDAQADAGPAAVRVLEEVRCMRCSVAGDPRWCSGGSSCFRCSKPVSFG